MLGRLYWMLGRLYWVRAIIEASLAPAKAELRAEAKADQQLNWRQIYVECKGSSLVGSGPNQFLF